MVLGETGNDRILDNLSLILAVGSSINLGRTTMKQTEFFNKTFAYALVAGLALAALPDMAWAQASKDSVGNVLNQVRQSQLPAIIQIMNAVFYIAGAGFGVSGLIGLRQHAENPSTKLAPQFAKLGVGGSLAAAPSLLSALQGSTFLGSGSPAVQQFNVGTF